MPLILAIEPDRRQAAQLTNVVRRRVGAELILVDNTERALDAIGNRVPDLMLVPALLSPQDDAALAGALRMIATAAHVQMLTIPVLGVSRPRARPGGVLAALRRDKSQARTPEGCDPAVFAEQIASYLEHVAEEHDETADVEEAVGPVEAVQTEAIPAEAGQAEAGEAEAGEAEAGQAEAGQAEAGQAEAMQVEAMQVEAVQEEAMQVEAVQVEAVQAEPVQREAEQAETVEEEPTAAKLWLVAQPLAAAPKPAAMPMLDEFLAALEQTPLPVIEQVVDAEWPDDDVEEDEDDIDLTADLDEAAMPAGPVEEEIEEAVEAVEVVEPPPSMMALAEMAREDEKLWISLSFGSRFTWPMLEGVPVEAAVDDRKIEWVELIASLRQDVERMRSGGVQPVVKGRSKKPKPVQDEWGFFDPEQCGFAALLSKLDEVTETEEGGRR